MGKASIVYGLKDPRTPDELSIRYVGFTTTSLKKRLGEHLADKVPCHRVSWIQSLLRQGIKPFMYVIEECKIEVLKEREIFWIKYYRDLGCDLVNATDGGDGLLNATKETRERIANSMRGEKNPFYGKKHTPESLEKMSAWQRDGKSPQLGKPMPNATKKKIGDAQRGEKNHRFGKKNSEEQINAIIDANTGRRDTPEVRAKKSASKTGENNPMFGKPVPQEHRDRISVALTGRKRQPHTPQARQKISIAHKGKILSPQHRAKIGAAQIGKTISQAQRDLISIANKGKKRTPEQIARSVNAKKEAKRIRELAKMESNTSQFS